MGGKLAVVVGGGPAPGINGVISAVTFEAVKQGLEVIGVYDGFKWLAKGDTHADPEAQSRTIFRASTPGAAPSSAHRARTRPRAPRRWPMWSRRSTSLGVKYLVTIGGDDTAFTRHAGREGRGGQDRRVPCPQDHRQ